MDQSAVQRYCLLLKNARGSAVVDLICKLTADASLFSFGEILCTPSVEELQRSEANLKFYTLLQLFAYGTWAEYKAAAAHLPDLSDGQRHKLKQLTVVSLASKSRVLPYADLMSQLDIASLRDLEDLLITDCLYAGLLKGRLDQQHRCFQVEEAISRDVKPEEVADITSALGVWLSESQAVLRTIEDRVSGMAAATAAAERASTDRQAVVEGEKKSLKAQLELQQQQQNDMLLDEDGASVAFMDEDRPAGARHSKRRR